jgi:hypothetical protein
MRKWEQPVSPHGRARTRRSANRRFANFTMNLCIVGQGLCVSVCDSTRCRMPTIAEDALKSNARDCK